MKMVKVRVGYEDGQHWMYRLNDDEQNVPLDPTIGITEVPEVILLQFEAWKDEGYLIWNRWVREVDNATFEAARQIEERES